MVTSSDIIAVCSAVISLCALVFTIRQARSTDEHQRLSVRPYIVSRRAKRRTDEGTYATFELLNVGLGPAVIESFKFTVEDKPLSGQIPDPIEEMLTRCLGGKIAFVLRRSSYPSPGYCIKVHEEYLVAEVFFPKITRDEEQRVDQLLKCVELEVPYASFYGERESFSTRNKSQAQPLVETAMPKDEGKLIGKDRINSVRTG